MASYGPPGGPGSGPNPSQDPWPDQRQYADPTDPWGPSPADPWGGQPASSPPGHASTSPPYGMPTYDPAAGTFPGSGGYPPPTSNYGYPDQPAEYAAPQAPPPPPPANRTGLIVGLAALAVLLVGAATLIFVLTRTDNPPPTGESPPPSSGPATSGQPGGGGGPTTGASPTDVRFVTVGQCVVNEGTNDDPKMRIVPCGPRTYEVIKRQDGTHDVNVCKGVPGYTDHFYFDVTLDSLDYVLCLKRQ